MPAFAISDQCKTEIRIQPHESDELVSQYLEFHYGDEHFGVANFARACAQICIERAQQAGIAGKQQGPRHRLRPVGRSAFELAGHFGHVDALDFSARFISSAVELQGRGSGATASGTGRPGQFPRDPDEWNSASPGMPDAAVSCRRTPQPELKYSGYDLVFAGNLIDQLYSPRRFLGDDSRRMRPGGLLILASPIPGWRSLPGSRSGWVGSKDQVGENYQPGWPERGAGQPFQAGR